MPRKGKIVSLNAQQKSLNKMVTFHGKGLHSGRMVRVEVHPASANYGIKFLRTDVDRAELIPALWSNITATELCTTLGRGENAVSTIEHLMAALAGFGIDNALVRINGPEVPIMDGSSKPFISAFKSAGISDLGVAKRYLVLKESFEFQSGDRIVRMEPSTEFSIACEIDYGKSFIGRQSLECTVNEANFLKLADARTFCHLNEVNALRSIGLAQGGSLDNAVVVTDSGVMNEEGLRGDDEFVRHKVLDCIGDFSLFGAQIIARVSITRPGHGFHAEIMKSMMQQKNRYFTVVAPVSSEMKHAPAAQAALVYG